MIESKIYESKTCTRVFYKEDEGSEIKDAFFETEAAAAVFVNACKDLGWTVSLNIWKWEIKCEL